MKIELQNFAILLDRMDAVYGLGDYVSGYCCVLLNGELDLNQLEIRLFGSAQTQWSESKGSGEDRTTQTCRGSHNYINISQFPANNVKQILTRGEHRIPFNFQLPFSDIANSFEAKYGYIRYFVEGIIHKPGLPSIKHRVKAPIKICFPISLAIEQLNIPIAYSNEKTIGCCFSKQFVQLKASIAHNGQRTGSFTSINCIAVNRSNTSMQLRARLKQKLIYRAFSSSKWDRKTLITVMGSAVSPGITNNETLSMPIPNDLPVLYNQCPIIELNYVIVVTLVIPGSIDLHIELPVVLTNQELPFHYT